MENKTPKQDKTLTLPAFITKENKLLVFVFSYLFFIVSYLILNHFHYFTPRQLPYTAIDEMIGFIPQTIWIYSSEYIFFVFVYFSIKNMKNLSPYFYAMISSQVISLIIFFFWPTTFPRDSFPLPADLDSLTSAFFAAGRNIDSPASCFPSLHVALVFLSALVFMSESRAKSMFVWVWSVLIIFSTITTKQHYFVDVVGGMALASAMYFYFFKVVKYKATSKDYLCWPLRT